MKSANGPSSVSVGPVGATAQGRSDQNRQLVRVFVHEFDLYPNLIRIKPGRILLSAQNEKRADIALVVERVGPGQSQQTARISLAGHVSRGGEEVALGAGEYVFYEESNPGLKGRLIVDPSEL